MTDPLPTERIALLTWALACGERLTNKEVAEKFGVTVPGAWLMLSKIARVVPVTTTRLDNRGTLLWHKME